MAELMCHHVGTLAGKYRDPAAVARVDHRVVEERQPLLDILSREVVTRVERVQVDPVVQAYWD